MCLLLDDLRKRGHRVDAALVRAGLVDALVDRIRERRYDFVALDSIFTVPLVRRLKEACPDVPVLVGGTNALPLFLFAPADWAIVGPGREAMTAFVDAFANGALPGAVPNLWFRRPDRSIDRTEAARDWALEPELVPFDPDLDWDYVGSDRSEAANTRFPSVVPELGCAFHVDSLSGPAYASLERGASSEVLNELPLSERARDGVRPFLDNTRGCAFCAFRFQSHVVDRAGEAVDRTAAQIETLSSRYGVREFSVQSENPFRFLVPLIKRIRARRLPVDALLVRTFPAVLARNPKLVTAGIEAAVEAGIRLHLQQLGFESFVQEELDHLGKGVRVEENVQAARLLFELQRRFPGTAHLFGGHGFILFTPWTRPEDVVENIRIVRDEAPFLAGSLGLSSRLCFYDPFNPIYRLAEREGLVMRSPHDYGLDFRFADDRTELMCRLALALERELVQGGEEAGPTVSRAVLTAVAPWFAGDGPATHEKSASTVFREAEARAKENVARDAELWPPMR
jgi:radical SAM superfamily enzyme YgiQ (UPF0313 family)